jgi:hemolysin III
MPMVHALQFPNYTRAERIADLSVHLTGLVAGPLAFLALLITAALLANAHAIVSVAIYGVGLLAMLTCSALYNIARPGRAKEVLRRFDHAAIFLMIAGSYTPFALNKIGGAWGWSLLAFVWAVAVGGIIVKFVCPRRLEGIAVALYLVLGWSVLVVLEPLFAAVSDTSIVLLMIGGVLYSAGVGLHLWRSLPFHNAGWHAMVLAAAGCHYAAILRELVL